MPKKKGLSNFQCYAIIIGGFAMMIIVTLTSLGVGWGFMLSILAGIRDFFVRRTVPSVIFLAYVLYNECKPHGLVRWVGRKINQRLAELVNKLFDGNNEEDHP